MALGHALNSIETNGLARLTNYGEYLEYVSRPRREHYRRSEYGR